MTLVSTLVASLTLGNAMAADRLTVVEGAQLLLFASLFGWTAFSCASAVAGFVVLWREGAHHEAVKIGARPRAKLSSRNALLMPICNEPADHVFSRLEAMAESIFGVGAGSKFDVFVLSDTRDATCAAAERTTYFEFRAKMGGRLKVYYRRRPKYTDRKAGNVADWVRRFGGAYDHMVVLDADSLMVGETLVELALEMERSPGVGLIQTVPTLVNSQTIFGKIEQFASSLYGPIFAKGLQWWSGAESSYWGHNAMVRVRAFAEQAGLPRLPGPAPFGGAIMSHDFVEAALMRRAGWEVRLAPDLRGSFEEGPPSLIDQTIRDRRWCQGNLQHLGVIAASGLHPVSRFHLLRGFSAYLTAPLWMGLLVIGVLLASFPALGGAMAGQNQSLEPQSYLALWGVLSLSLGFVLLPKGLAWLILVRQQRLANFGGGAMALAGVCVETLISTLMAPAILFSTNALCSRGFSGKRLWLACTEASGRAPKTYASH